MWSRDKGEDMRFSAVNVRQGGRRMKQIHVAVTTVYLLGLVVITTPALALTVQIGGVEIPWKQNDPNEPATERALSGPNGEAVSYGCFTIAGLSSTPNPKARAVVDD